MINLLFIKIISGVVLKKMKIFVFIVFLSAFIFMASYIFLKTVDNYITFMIIYSPSSLKYRRHSRLLHAIREKNIKLEQIHLFFLHFVVFYISLVWSQTLRSTHTLNFEDFILFYD